MNYRSVMILGMARELTDELEKRRALEAIVEHISPGRSAEVRAPDRKELRATSVLRLPVSEVSAQIRTGPPIDAAKDYARGAWAGVLPLKLSALPPLADPRLPAGVAVPPGVVTWSGGRLQT